MTDTLVQDLRYTWRTLRRDTGFAAFAILIIGLGIGASSTVFSVLHALLLEPLPFRQPEQLVWIANRDVAGLSGQTTQVGHMLDLTERTQSFSDIAGYMAFYGVGDNLLTSGSGEPERLTGVPVSANFFSLLGVQPQIGRQFTAEECKWHGPKAVMLSHGLWERRFASDPGIVGRSLIIDGQPTTVAGVLPAGFDFAQVFAPGGHMDLFFPFALSPETNRWGNTMAMVGRLKPGVSVAMAQAEIRILAPQLSAAHQDRNPFEGRLSPLADHVTGRIRLALMVLGAAVGVVMLIVCANLSNLLLARTAARQKEIAVRAALGAGKARLIRQMLTEGLALSLCGAAVGVALAYLGTWALAHLRAISIPLLASVRVDPAALGFTLLVAVATGVVFGLAPAIQVGAGRLHDALKDSNRGSTGRGHVSLRGALVVAEIAFACVLLVGAGLLVRSFLRVLDVQLGFRPEQAATVRIDPDQSYDTQAKQNAFFDEALRRVREVPGIQSVGLTDSLPLGVNRTWGAGEKGHTYPKGKFPTAFVRVVSDGYVGAMGIPLKKGRDISVRDTPTTDPVIVINETMARTLFAGQDPLGHIIRACGERQVVGVVGDVRHLALEQGAGMEMYLPMRQCRDISSVHLVVRSSLPPEQLVRAVRDSLKPLVPNVPGNDFRILQDLVDTSVSPRRFIVWLIGGFAGFALILASLGIYAVISYSVNQRTQEIGIRMALGASAGNVQRRVLLQTMRLAGLGMILGGAASWFLARALEGLLYEVKAGDPLTFGMMLAVLSVVAVLAGYFPARRASLVDPSIALRAS